MKLFQKEKKRVMWKHSFYDRTHIQRYLETMAMKGWMLEKITTFYWQFKRIPPQKLHFSINYFPTASEFEAEPSEQLLTIREFCAHAGWEFVAANAQMQIYCNAQPQPTPIETDALVEVDTIHRAMKKSFLPGQIVLLLLAIFQMILQCNMIHINPLQYFSNGGNLIGATCWIVVLLLCCVELFGYLHWYKKARYVAEVDGAFFSTPNYRYVTALLISAVLIAFFLWLLTLQNSKMLFIVVAMLLAVAFIFCFTGFLRDYMKQRKKSAKINRIVVIAVSIGGAVLLSVGIVFGTILGLHMGWFEEDERYDTYEYRGNTFRMYHDELPLTVVDFLPENDAEYSSYWDGNATFLLGVYDGYQRPRMDVREAPGIRYTVYDVKWNVLYDLCLDELLHQYDDLYDEEIPENWREKFCAIDATAWDATIAYQQFTDEVSSNHYILCYDAIIVELVADWELTDAQKRIVGEKLTQVAF